MCKPIRHRATSGCCVGRAVFSAMIISQSAVSYGGEGTPLTNDVEKSTYIRDCRQALEQGAALEEVLDTLLEIAISGERSLVKVNTLALSALIHLAREPDVIRRYLLEILDDSSAPRSSRSLASSTLAFVADESTERHLLAKLVDAPDRQEESLYFMPLRKRASKRLIPWIEGAAIRAGLDPATDEAASWMTQEILTLQSAEACLAQIRSEHPVPSGGYLTLVLRARRHGATRPQIKAAVLDHIQMRAQGLQPEPPRSDLVEAAVRCQALTVEDLVADERLRRALDSVTPMDCPRSNPRWATRQRELWAEFYNIDIVDLCEWWTQKRAELGFESTRKAPTIVP